MPISPVIPVKTIRPSRMTAGSPVTSSTVMRAVLDRFGNVDVMWQGATASRADAGATQGDGATSYRYRPDSERSISLRALMVGRVPCAPMATMTVSILSTA